MGAFSFGVLAVFHKYTYVLVLSRERPIRNSLPRTILNSFFYEQKRLDGVFHHPVDRVTHVSTNPARPSLTSVIGRELVYSRRYDANRMTLSKRPFYLNFQ